MVNFAKVCYAVSRRESMSLFSGATSVFSDTRTILFLSWYARTQIRVYSDFYLCSRKNATAFCGL